jgi:hypothetical protein
MKYAFVGILTVAGVALSGLFAQPASAQYPPPASAVALAASDIAPAVGDTVSIAATITDATGDPVTGTECTFAITSQPGDDASVEAGPVMTNEDGIAATLLNIGSAEGTIVIEADCGELSGLVSVVAGAAEEPDAQMAPPAPAATAGDLPAAGDAPGEAAEHRAYFWAALALALVVAPGALYLSVRLRRSRR